MSARFHPHFSSVGHPFLTPPWGCQQSLETNPQAECNSDIISCPEFLCLISRLPDCPPGYPISTSSSTRIYLRLNSLSSASNACFILYSLITLFTKHLLGGTVPNWRYTLSREPLPLMNLGKHAITTQKYRSNNNMGEELKGPIYSIVQQKASESSLTQSSPLIHGFVLCDFSHLHSTVVQTTKWKIAEINNSWVLNGASFWVVWWNIPMSACPTQGINHPFLQRLQALHGPHPFVSHLVAILPVTSVIREATFMSCFYNILLSLFYFIICCC